MNWRASNIERTIALAIERHSMHDATGSGSITCDDALSTGVGDELLGSSDFMVELMLFGQTFTHGDDIDFALFRELWFFNGEIEVLNFLIAEIAFDPARNPVMIDEPNVVSIERFEAFAFSGSPGLLVSVFVVTPIPAPATIPLMGLAGLIAMRKSKSR
jgi:hypothetical protein